MRTARNIAIIALLAVPVAFLPGGGVAADTVITALTMAFLATLGFAVWEIYRANRLTVDTLPDDQRAVLLGSVGILVLMVAGADEMLGGGGLGAFLWVILVVGAAIAIYSVWARAHTY